MNPGYEELKEKANKRMSSVKKKIVVMSGKGGVGKSTVAVNLAAALKEKGYEVGILDVDIHGPNVAKMLCVEDDRIVETEEGLSPVTIKEGPAQGLKVMSMAFLVGKEDPVVWRGPAKMSAIAQLIGEVAWGDLDALIVDLPPGTGDEALSIAQLIPGIDGTIIVTTPQDVALLDSKRSVNFSKKLGIPVLGIIENMSGYVCPHCGEKTEPFKSGGGKKAAEEHGVPFLGAVPMDPSIMESGDCGRPFSLVKKRTPAAEEFAAIVEEIRLE